ncbi:helix-turn-helix domain-containing protein [Viridibacillus sp. FSL H8-0123]|uniref:helix-turn-helix domain-containing protein n=1 Tax=Viridibacillus sp. FSL H8-0123 TaxID=1928922 RepID=UPI00096CCCE9|nr:helix-turn-helix domain-containing protein [Viridibacillus sp. FSL H8-0123]OMC84130.1 transcriptional regulator [Viridibacillus sp. FSL H8-0123]
MNNKAEVLIHPVRMKISQALMRNKETGLTPLEMVKIIEDVPQATLYRHIQVLLDAGIIQIIKEKKVRSVFEKYYSLNEEAARLDSEEWQKLSKEEKVNYLSYYQLSLMTQYESYLSGLELDGSKEDKATFSLLELKIDDEHFDNFQQELNSLMVKYYNKKINNQNIPTRTVAVTIIPKS